jgi:hypothetical protein
MTPPCLVLVPGAWHKPDHYRPLTDELWDIDVHTVTLRSSGDDPAALARPIRRCLASSSSSKRTE